MKSIKKIVLIIIIAIFILYIWAELGVGIFFKTHGVVAKLSVELAITHNDV